MRVARALPERSRWEIQLLLYDVEAKGVLFPPPIRNLALDEGVLAAQSTNYPGVGADDAYRAIDGITGGDYDSARGTATNWEVEPWHRVDLGENREITSIYLWNRTDCCRDRLDQFRVTVF